MNTTNKGPVSDLDMLSEAWFDDTTGRDRRVQPKMYHPFNERAKRRDTFVNVFMGLLVVAMIVGGFAWGLA